MRAANAIITGRAWHHGDYRQSYRRRCVARPEGWRVQRPWPSRQACGEHFHQQSYIRAFAAAESARRTGLDVSCLIGNPRVDVAAALGVPFLAGGTNEGNERKLIPAVRKCADAITDVLGFAGTKIVK